MSKSELIQTLIELVSAKVPKQFSLAFRNDRIAAITDTGSVCFKYKDGRLIEFGTTPADGWVKWLNGEDVELSN